MSTHEAIALGEQLEGAVIDDAGRGEFYVSRFEGHREVEPPHLVKALDGESIVVADFLQRGNVAGACARRAHELAAANALDRYADVTPIYVRLAEAEVKLQQKNG